MGTVTIRCPRTGQAVSTGIETELSVLRQLPAVEARHRCPVCGEVHGWTVDTAWLSDAPLSEATLAPGTEKDQRGPVSSLP